MDSQFRCNGSDGYLAWVDDVLNIHATANADSYDYEYDTLVHPLLMPARSSNFHRPAHDVLILRCHPVE
ncbi:DNA/RNA helicase domain-containing protein [Paenibacillus agricola]|uniref:DUF2075 domain-containing protein n=1 Tax=Paenibacillus agricola TaxID=2716264 RepID=A0ABX0J229_9BACL|nr:DUF2075 domain-containing protein [Paenibacillus agricola]